MRLSTLRLLLTVEFFERFQLLDQSLILILQQRHAILQTLDVLFLLASTLARCLPATYIQTHTHDKRRKHSCSYSPHSQCDTINHILQELKQTNLCSQRAQCPQMRVLVLLNVSLPTKTNRTYFYTCF